VSTSPFVRGYVVPGLPHPLLAAEKNAGWMRLRKAFEAARDDLQASGAEVLLIYSTMWPSVIGHQVQARPEPEWVHVDELFHDLGSIPYRFRMDTEFAQGFVETARARGLEARTVDYHGFPIDTGSVVALKLLNPDNAIPACIVSSNVYADRAETIVLGKAAAETLERQGKRGAAVAVMTFSNRLFSDWVAPQDDRIHSGKDDEWNRKILEFLALGRLEDVAQLSREIQRQIRVRKVVSFKPMWWLSAALGQHNRYAGRVYDYAPIHGAGAAVVGLAPSRNGVGDKEYDEENVEVYHGERHVLEETGEVEAPAEAAPGSVQTSAAPKPVGAYVHARRVGDLLFLAGIGPRMPVSDEIPGGPIRDADGNPRDYDVEAQTRQVVRNVEAVLHASGATLADIIDVSVFLVDMDRDFQTFNRVYREYFESVGATRTTVAVDALPTPIAVEFKVIARAPRS